MVGPFQVLYIYIFIEFFKPKYLNSIRFLQMLLGIRSPISSFFSSFIPQIFEKISSYSSYEKQLIYQPLLVHYNTYVKPLLIETQAKKDSRMNHDTFSAIFVFHICVSKIPQLASFIPLHRDVFSHVITTEKIQRDEFYPGKAGHNSSYNRPLTQ